MEVSGQIDPVRLELARGLFNTLLHAQAENDLARRDALLDELRALTRDYPDDAAPREKLLALQKIS
jgi:hypothetical protein